MSEPSLDGASGESDGGATHSASHVGLLCKLLMQKTSTRSHLRAAKLMLTLNKNIALVPAECAVRLSILLMSMYRRLLRMREDSEESEEAEVGAFETTLVLVFLLIVGVHARETAANDDNDANDANDANDDHHRIESFESLQEHSLWQQLCRHPSSSNANKKKRKHEDSQSGDFGDFGDFGDCGLDDELDGGFSDVASLSSQKTQQQQQKKPQQQQYSFSSQQDVDELNSQLEKERDAAEALVRRSFLVDPSSSRWADVLYNAKDLAADIMRFASKKLGIITSASEMRDVAMHYTRTMLAESRSRLLTVDRGQNFISLKVSSLLMLGNSGVADVVGSLIASAESEAGQVVYRDILLSFLLPLGFVGVRRTLLLPRGVSARATKEYSSYVSLAHESAICGLVDAADSGCELKRACAILTTIALLTTGSDIRSDVAFNGRACLPFLETPEPQRRGALQLALDAGARQWTVFSTSSSKPRIELAGSGVETLETALVLIADDLKS